MVIQELITELGFDVDDAGMKRFDKGLRNVRSSLTKIGVAIGAVGAGIGAILNEAGKQEQVNIAFETIIGDADLAQKKLSELYDFAAKTPFTVPGIEASAKQLLAMGIDIDSLMPTMKALGDVSAGLSVPMGRLALNFGQVRAQGRLTGREVRDFAIAGVPLVEQLAGQLNRSTEEIQDMVSAGEIGFEEVEQAFIDMSSEGGKFNDLMIKQSKSLLGLKSNIIDIGIIYVREVGQHLLPQAKELANEFLNWVEANEKIIKQNMVKFVKNLAQFLGDLIYFLKGVFTVLDGLVPLIGGWNNAMKISLGLLSALVAGQFLLGILQIATGLKAAMAAAGGFWAVMLAPATLAIALVALLSLMVEDFIKYMNGNENTLTALLLPEWGIMKDGWEYTIDRIKEWWEDLLEWFGLNTIGGKIMEGLFPDLSSIRHERKRQDKHLGVPDDPLGAFSLSSIADMISPSAASFAKSISNRSFNNRMFPDGVTSRQSPNDRIMAEINVDLRGYDGDPGEAGRQVGSNVEKALDDVLKRSERRTLPIGGY